MCVDWHQKDRSGVGGPVGRCRLVPKVPNGEEPELIPYKEEGGEIARGLPVVPAPALGAGGEVGRGQR